MNTFAPQSFFNVEAWIVDFLKAVSVCMNYSRNNQIEELIVDVRSNGGGIICLSFGVMAQLIPEWREDPLLIWEPYDFRKSDITDRLIYFAEDWLGDFLDPKTGAEWDPRDWYYNGTLSLRGGKYSNYTKVKTFFF
jgi:hypothetical protein